MTSNEYSNKVQHQLFLCAYVKYKSKLELELIEIPVKMQRKRNRE